MKETETPRAKNSPEVNGAVSGACTHSVECFTLAWTAGLLAAFLHDPLIAVLLCIFGILAALGRKTCECLLILLGAVLGVLCFQLYDLRVRQPLLALDGQTKHITGTVSACTAGRNGMIYTLYTAPAGHRVPVDWYAPEDAPALRIGDTVELNADFSRIQSDYRYHTAAYQAGRGKYLRIYDAEIVQITPDTGFSLRRTLAAYRENMIARIAERTQPETFSLLCAMVFGERSALSDETAEDLTRAGIGHVTAVSGLHLVFFCGAAAWLLRRMKLSAKTVCLLHIPVIILFITLVDPSVSAYRAAVMIMLTQSAALFGRQGNTLRSLCIAMFLCTLSAPYVIGSVSFWLSVSGVFGIGVLAPFMTKDMQGSRLLRSFLQLCCVAAAVIPASVLFCGESSLISPIGNLVILPLCLMMLYLGFFLLLTGGLTAFLLPLADLFCRPVLFFAHRLAALPFSHMTVSAAPVRITILMLTAIILLSMIYGAKPRQLANGLLIAALLTAVFSAAVSAHSASQLRIAVLGGKRQAAAVISAGGSTIIADLTGSPRNAEYAARYLHDQGISHCDVLMLNGDSAVSGYLETLGNITFGAVLVRNSKLSPDAVIHGTKVLTAGDGAFAITCGDAEIRMEGKILQIAWNGMNVTALPFNAAETPLSEAVIRYGASECTVTLTVPNETRCGSQLVLCLTKDGCGEIRALT